MRDAAIVGHGDLAIDDQLVPGGGERGKGRAEGLRPVIPVAADQRQAAAAIDDGDQPVAVMLDLVQPALAIGRRRARRNDLQTHRIRAGAPATRLRAGPGRHARKIALAGRIGRRQPARGCGASWNASRNQCPLEVVLQRRADAERDNFIVTIRINRLVVHPASRIATIDDKRLRLTPRNTTSLSCSRCARARR